MHGRSRVGYLASHAAWAIGLLLAFPGPGSSEEAESRGVEIAWFGAHGSKRLVLDIEIGGKPLSALWDETIATLHRHFDRDDNSVLDEREAARLPSAFGLRQLTWGIFQFDGPSPPWVELDADGDGRLGAAELSKYYRRKGVGPALLAFGKPPFTGRLNAAIIKALDADGDSRLSATELRKAESLLSLLDRNGDERLAASEIVATTSYPGTQATTLFAKPAPGHPGSLAEFPLILLPSHDEDDRSAEALARRLGLAPEASALRSWRGDPPARTWRVRLDDPTVPADESASARYAPASGRGPWLTVAEGEVVCEFRSDEGTSSTNLLAHRKQIAALFRTADQNSDRRVAGAELEDPTRAPLVLALAWADRDGDKALSQEELDAWLELAAQLIRGRVLVSILDHGRGLFELIDADHDGTLAIRELRSAADRLDRSGGIVDGVVDPAKLPRTLIGCVSCGHPRHLLATRPSTGPDWFQGMDRNRDGDISLREWAGDAALFSRLDRDHDDLLSPEEASRTP